MFSICGGSREEEMATTPVFLPAESRGQKSLVGCCPWGHTESDTTKHLSMHTCIGERNGNPLQFSCLENPRDREAMEGYSPWGHKELDTN